MCYECVRINKGTFLILLGVIFCLLLLLDTDAKADTYKQDIIGFGAVNSDINFYGLGDHIRSTDGDFAIGRQLQISSEGNSLFSGFELKNASDGTYRSWGVIGNTAHSVDINKAKDVFIISQFSSELKTINDGIEEPTESYFGGLSSINGTFNGSSVEKLSTIEQNDCKGNKPLDISETRLYGSFEINSEVVVI